MILYCSFLLLRVYLIVSVEGYSFSVERILMFITITRSISLCIPSSKCFGIDLVYEHIFTLKYTLENTKGAIKNGQFRETDHIGYTICVEHKYVVHHFTIPPIEQDRLLSSSLT